MARTLCLKHISVCVCALLSAHCASPLSLIGVNQRSAAAESLLFGPRGTEARYCVKQSGAKTHRSIPRCFPTVCFAVGEINNCGLWSGFSLLSWPFHLSSSYCSLVYSAPPQKTDSSSTIFGCRHFRYWFWRLMWFTGPQLFITPIFITTPSKLNQCVLSI